MDEQLIFQARRLEFAQLATMPQHQEAEPMQLGQRKAERVGAVQDVGAVLVVVGMRDQAADLVQLRGPAKLALVARQSGLSPWRN